MNQLIENILFCVLAVIVLLSVFKISRARDNNSRYCVYIWARQNEYTILSIRSFAPWHRFPPSWFWDMNPYRHRYRVKLADKYGRLRTAWVRAYPIEVYWPYDNNEGKQKENGANYMDFI